MRTLTLIALLALTGCSGGSDSEGPTTPPLAESYWAADAPKSALSPLEAREKGTEGTVWIHGKVGELASNRAQFQLVDPSYEACSENEDDTCATPWDFCCYSPEERARGSVIVQFRDSEGKLLQRDLQGFHGFDHLRQAWVRGKPERDDAGNLILVAEAIHVKE
ncbi:MAG: hypothetical protein RL885_18705 [Planctomycetota bacterium]